MHFQSVERFLHWLEALMQAHGWFAVGGFIAGCLFVGILLGYFAYRGFRRVQRIVALAEERGLEKLEVWSLFHFNGIRVKRGSDVRRRPRGYALQAPAVRGQGTLQETVRVEDGILTYYFPENDPANPEGIQFPAAATWILGNPPNTAVPIEVTPVVVPRSGRWYPAIIDTRTGVAHPRSHSRWRKYWAHGYRNLFIGDFVAAGDPIGTVQSATGLHSEHVVPAPTSGFILQFGVLPFTPVAANAIVMLLGAPQDMRELAYHGDYAGFLKAPEGDVTTYVGRVVEAGTVLGVVSFLMGSIKEPIVAPVRLRIVRQHIHYGDAVQYKQTLFTYIPIEPSSPH